MATRKTMYTTSIINRSSVVQMDRWSILKIVTDSEHYSIVHIVTTYIVTAWLNQCKLWTATYAKLYKWGVVTPCSHWWQGPVQPVFLTDSSLGNLSFSHMQKVCWRIFNWLFGDLEPNISSTNHLWRHDWNINCIFWYNRLVNVAYVRILNSCVVKFGQVIILWLLFQTAIFKVLVAIAVTRWKKSL